MTTITNEMIITKEIIESLTIGDILPNCFGQMKPITTIFGKGISEVDGKMFLCFYQQFSETSTMSNSIREGQTVSIIGK